MDFIMFERQGKTPKLQIVEADKAVSIPEDAVSFTYVSGNERLENGSYKYVKYAIGYPVKIFMGGLHYGLNGYQVHSGSYNDKYYLYSNGSGVQMIHAIDSNVNLEVYVASKLQILHLILSPCDSNAEIAPQTGQINNSLSKYSDEP